MNAFAEITSVQIELSNRCGYSAIHPRCPNDPDASPRNLPLALVENLLAELGQVAYHGNVLFSAYNQTLTDPRLFYILDYLRSTCPNAEPYMYTNSWNLDQQLLDEIARFGVTRVYANAYTQNEKDRVASLCAPPGMVLHRKTRSLDDRLRIYEGSVLGWKRPCPALRCQVVIWHSGMVGLCCFDWKESVTFGSLHESQLSELLMNPERIEMSEALVQGKRSCTQVCARCTRRWKREVDS